VLFGLLNRAQSAAEVGVRPTGVAVLSDALIAAAWSGNAPIATAGAA